MTARTRPPPPGAEPTSRRAALDSRGPGSTARDEPAAAPEAVPETEPAAAPEDEPGDEIARLRAECARADREREALRCQLAQVEAERLALRGELAHVNQHVARLHDQLLHPQRVESAGTLAAGLAHDMNNVLAAIMGLAEVALDDRLDPRLRSDLEQIVSEAERGAGLTRSLLAFSRKGQYRKQVLEIDDTLRDALPLLAHTLPKTIELRCELGAGAVRVDGDPVQLVQVLVNFALNAADAMHGAGVLSLASAVVELEAEPAQLLELAPGRYVRLRVTDTGSGMDDATRRRIFEPFFTTKPVGKGTGLGLALVWGVVKGHLGAVDVESELGNGTSFSVYLPVTEAPLPAARGSTGLRRDLPADTTILVVDDEPVVRAGITRILERIGYTVLGAADGAEALRAFAAHQASIGLVVLDMGMPVMDGAECFRQLRRVSGVPVLIATGYALDEQLQAMIAHGAAVIEKPFSSASLLVEVTRLLERRAAARRRAR